MTWQRRVVAIIGGRSVSVRDPRSLALAEEVGCELARRDYAVVTGGEDGIGGAVSKGRVEAGGLAIALMRTSGDEHAHNWVSLAIPTALDLARSMPLNWTGDGVIAFEGGYGTLCELALALDTQRPLVVVGSPRYLRHDEVPVAAWKLFDDVGSVTAKDVVDAFVARVPGPE